MVFKLNTSFQRLHWSVDYVLSDQEVEQFKTQKEIYCSCLKYASIKVLDYQPQIKYTFKESKLIEP